MPRFISFAALLLLLWGCGKSDTSWDSFQSASVVSAAQPIAVAKVDWPWWRGPTRNGVAAADQQPPSRWSDSENILWKTPVPGRGHGSPTVVGDRVFLATADEQQEVQSVLCFDRHTGERLWITDVHRGGLTEGGHQRSSHASSTVACDGERIFINFLNNDAVYTSSLSVDGEPLWREKITDYQVHQGYGSSPLLYETLVIVTADNKAGGAIAALDRASGEMVWRHGRPKQPNYASPILLSLNGEDRVLVTGSSMISCFDPATGEKLWETAGATEECVTSAVTDGTLVFTSGGYPRSHVAAVRADGTGEVVWDHSTRVYVPSMIIHEGHLFAVTDAGVAMCWKADTGEEVWKGRLGGTHSASLVLVGDTLYATNEAGTTFLIRATPDKFERITENSIPGEVFATPAICGGRIYMRIAQQQDGRRQEMLYCVGDRQPVKQ
jgi:outer membrane protein assembly factor BamB